MEYKFLTGYIILSIIIAGTDFCLAYKSFNKKGSVARYLAYTCIFAGLVDITYLCSVTATGYFATSFASSLYFILIDWMLISLSHYMVYRTRVKINKMLLLIKKLVIGYACLEGLLFMLNPFYEIMISYKERAGIIARYVYDMKPPYYCHLAFTYGLVVAVLLVLIFKVFNTPRQYRSQYTTVLFGIIVIVWINAIFLMQQNLPVISNLDVSIMGYSAALYIMYYSTFYYGDRVMLKELAMTIFGDIDQGIVLFDYDNLLVMQNKRAEKLIGADAFESGMSVEAFLDKCNMKYIEELDDDSYSVQCYVDKGGTKAPLRCDFRRIRENDKVIGNLYVFTDVAMETDLLTGFHNWEHFKKFAAQNPDNYSYPTSVLVVDINNLSVINSSFGRDEGDKRLAALANLMRQELPPASYFVRGRDARLIALCYMLGDINILNKRMERIKEQFSDGIQYAISITSEKQPDIILGIEEADNAMQVKKMMDKDSAHSQLLTTLVKALQESDSDTEAHVKRTQEMGERLGRRIGFSDAQIGQLSLLCLLHDIGKIGIPLEILNKPGKLNKEEWNILKSHVYKGFQIAMSSKEISGIAEMILRHHERWDGNGYPDGLSRESIPLLSRVISIVDSYDAMVSDRVYRKGMSTEAAKAELKRCAGTQFDPFLVSEFIQMIEEEYENPETKDSSLTEPDVITADTNTAEEVKESENKENRESFAVHGVKYSRYLLNDKEEIIEIDENFTDMTGYTYDEVVTNKVKQFDLIPEEDRTNYILLVGTQLSENNAAYIEHRLIRKDGSHAYVFCYGKRYFDPVSKEGRSELIISDSANTYTVKTVVEAETSKAEQRLLHWEKTYRKDPLTGLYNHASYQSDVEMKLLKEHNKVLFIMMDVDKFKQYNDTYGHSAGDEFLILLGNTIKGTLRKADMACRMGGDEFSAALFFKEESEDSLMYERARQIFDKINMTLRATKGDTSLSMGIVLADSRGTTFKELYRKADAALYRAKEEGRNRMNIYDDSLNITE